MSRASTSGWSIENIILDTTGGILSLAQLLLDAYISGHWEGVTGNPAKLGMAFLSLGFDSVFFFQHFCLYAEAPNVAVVEEEAGRSGSRASRRNGRTSRAEGARETDPLLGSQTPEPAATTTV
jgi:cystinosin